MDVGEIQTKLNIGQSVHTVSIYHLTFLRTKEMSYGSWAKVRPRFPKRLLRRLNLIRLPFDELLTSLVQSRRPVQMDPTFVRQVGEKSNPLKWAFAGTRVQNSKCSAIPVHVY